MGRKKFFPHNSFSIPTQYDHEWVGVATHKGTYSPDGLHAHYGQQIVSQAATLLRELKTKQNLEYPYHEIPYRHP